MKRRKENMSKVYALSLAQGKFYVGSSDQLENRLDAHWNGTKKAAAWTRMYKPTCHLETIEGTDPFLEDSVTLQYMSKYGIENVRGGSYSNPNLSAGEIQGIEKRLRHVHDECLHCGGNDHFVKDCPNREASKKRSCNGNGGALKRYKTGECYRCGRMGHFQGDCYAKTHVNGDTLEDETDDEESGDHHENESSEDGCDDSCNGYGGVPTHYKTGECYRCGRMGHFQGDCYARTHVNGDALEDETDDEESEASNNECDDDGSDGDSIDKESDDDSYD
jgi:GAG-polyprotein viral zinc-finger